MFEYSGFIHIHSLYSDGTGKIEDIARFAAESGLDFIIMTDHNTLKPKNDGYEKWINGVMVIIGYEVNDIHNRNHYLVFGLDEVIGSYSEIANGETACLLSAPEYVRKVKEKGGIGFIAHPDEERKGLPGQQAYPWTAETDDYTGIEIWNHMSQWIEGMNQSNKLDRFLHPLKSVTAPSQKTLDRWDTAALSRHVTGIGGVDAHALKQNILGLFEVEIFPYKVLFKSIRTHVFLNDPIEKSNDKLFNVYKMNILKALETGKCFISNHYLGDARGFRFFAEYNGKNYNTGDEISINDGKVILRTLVPKPCNIKIVHNGNMISESESMNHTIDVKEKGIYRAECFRGGKAWIFSNHIRIV
ncbi:MAG: CehA/McbA family metallohydrolase [Ignavibacteria bacterium]|nr:CehA/McbA family metallohydrolase [Ignavibacteria bacterium]